MLNRPTADLVAGLPSALTTNLIGRVGDAVDAVRRGGRMIESGVVGALGLIPRLIALTDAAEVLVREAAALVARIGRTEEAAALAVAGADGLIAEAGAVIARGDQVAELSASLIDEAERTLLRTARLLDDLEPALRRLGPTLDRLAETTDPDEVEALVRLIDHLPVLAGRLERDVLPVLTTLGSVAPDLHDLLDVSRELNEMLGKVPGLGRIKRKVDEQQALDQAAGADS